MVKQFPQLIVLVNFRILLHSSRRNLIRNTTRRGIASWVVTSAPMWRTRLATSSTSTSARSPSFCSRVVRPSRTLCSKFFVVRMQWTQYYQARGSRLSLAPLFCNSTGRGLFTFLPLGSFYLARPWSVCWRAFGGGRGAARGRENECVLERSGRVPRPSLPALVHSM